MRRQNSSFHNKTNGVPTPLYLSSNENTKENNENTEENTIEEKKKSNDYNWYGSTEMTATAYWKMRSLRRIVLGEDSLKVWKTTVNLIGDSTQ